MGQVLTKNEGFSDFCEGWIPFLLEIKQKAGWLVGMDSMQDCLYRQEEARPYECWKLSLINW